MRCKYVEMYMQIHRMPTTKCPESGDVSKRGKCFLGVKGLLRTTGVRILGAFCD
jgi:hypothetical protein